MVQPPDVRKEPLELVAHHGVTADSGADGGAQ